MKKSCTLASGKKFELSKQFPTLNDQEMIALCFTGGADSMLLAQMAIHLYGIDKIVFVLNTFDDTGNFGRDQAKRERVQRDFYRWMTELEVPHFFEVTQEYVDNKDHYHYYVTALVAQLQKDFGNVVYVLGGWSAIQREHIDMLKEANWEKGRTRDEVRSWIMKEENLAKYPAIKTHLTEFNGDVYFIGHLAGFEHVQDVFERTVRPFDNLMSYEIYELYKLQGLTSLLVQTNSCNRGDKEEGNCGESDCKNCTERKWNFTKAGIVDETVYLNG